jgi:hypothetical protein
MSSGKYFRHQFTLATGTSLLGTSHLTADNPRKTRFARLWSTSASSNPGGNDGDALEFSQLGHPARPNSLTPVLR